MIPQPKSDAALIARPFLKWAGGKTQLLGQLRSYYPPGLSQGQLKRYVEPFLGGGAVFLDVAQSHDIAEAFLSDINPELILAYSVVQRDPDRLIERLAQYRQQYFALDEDARKVLFYQVRDHYNEQKPKVDFTVYSERWIAHAADMIFLNKTCFNGLFRVNSRGLFNVPFGAYKNPAIFEEQNIWRVSALLQHAVLSVGEFRACERLIDDRTFVYFDPPYRPLTTTASFTSYAKGGFGDDMQIALAQFYANLDVRYGAKLMLSNSDPRNSDPTDNFFDDLYADYHIYRVHASRMINSDAQGRGKITEILVTNY